MTHQLLPELPALQLPSALAKPDSHCPSFPFLSSRQKSLTVNFLFRMLSWQSNLAKSLLTWSDTGLGGKKKCYVRAWEN